MRLNRALSFKSIVRGAMSAALATMLSAAVATAALAAGHGGRGGHGAGRIRGGSSGQLFSPGPSMTPNFNPSQPYTLPEAPEVPVSPHG
jgi:hypothetical protein